MSGSHPLCCWERLRLLLILNRQIVDCMRKITLKKVCISFLSIFIGFGFFYLVSSVNRYEDHFFLYVLSVMIVLMINKISEKIF